MFFLLKALCYSFVYIVPRYILRKKVGLKRLVIFLVISCVTLPILRDNLSGTDAKNCLDGYGDLILSFFLVV